MKLISSSPQKTNMVRKFVPSTSSIDWTFSFYLIHHPCSRPMVHRFCCSVLPLFLWDRKTGGSPHTSWKKETNSLSASTTNIGVAVSIMLCGSKQKLTSTSMIGRCFGRRDISHRSLRSTGGHHTHTCRTHIFPARCISSHWLIGRWLRRRDNRSPRLSSQPHTHIHLTHTHPVLWRIDSKSWKSVTEVNLKFYRLQFASKFLISVLFNFLLSLWTKSS